MEQIFKNRFLWGLLLLAIGIIVLLQNLNLFKFIWSLLWIGVLVVGGAFFVATFLGSRANWWAIIPGTALWGLAMTVGIKQVFPWLGDRLGGAILMILLAQGFGMVYLRERNHWWAIIPGGVLLTIAVVMLTEMFLSRTQTGGLFLLGLGATFGLVYLLPTSQGRMHWASIPAIVLVIIGLFIIFVNAQTLRIIWPLAIILTGIWLLIQAGRSPKR